ALMLLVWVAYVLVQTTALALGLWLGRGAGAAVRPSPATAGPAMGTPAPLFVGPSLALWAGVGYVTGRQLTEFMYLPLIFGAGYRSGEIYVDSRIQTLGAFFTPMVVAFTVLALMTLLVLVPSLREEIKPTTNVDAHGRRRDESLWSERLG